MKAISIIRSKTVVLPGRDIDTDQILPARFLTTTSRHGLGPHLFADWRYDENENPKPDFPLNQTDPKDYQILVAGANFGCGSSREHAVWALLDYGIKAVISTDIADIFNSNAIINGLLPIIVSQKTHDWLSAHGGETVEIDLNKKTVTLGNGKIIEFPIDPFARNCLLQGTDPLGFLLQQQEKITAYEQSMAD
jgi:3-isopropylmalate/(R)-2-methylmalate dehydratase small subunit